MPPQFSCVPLRSTSENCAVLPCFSDFGCFPTAHFLTFPNTTDITTTKPGNYTYKWYRVDTETNAETLISSATEGTYTPQSADDVGKKIKVVVTAANCSGELTATTGTTVAKADSTISINPTTDPKTVEYTGNAVTYPAQSDVTKTGSNGEVTFTYYTADTCKDNETTTPDGTGAAHPGGAPKNAGNYWVKATVAADGTHNGATSDAAAFKITPKGINGLTVDVTAAQTAVQGDGSFVQPTLKGLNDEKVNYTLTYSITADEGSGVETVTNGTYEQAKSSLAKAKADAEITVNYTFTATDDTSYTGSKTDTIKVTVKDIAFTVGNVAASADNAVTVKTAPTYGDTWAQIVTVKSSDITAMVGDRTVQGTYTVVSSDDDTAVRPKAGDNKSYTVKFTSNDNKYTGVTVFSGTVNVAKKTVTVSGITAKNKVYDGTNNATTDTSNAIIDGLVQGDNVSVSASGTFADVNAGKEKTVNLTLTLVGADKANYALDAASQKTAATIAQREVTLKEGSVTATNREYKPGDKTVKLTKGEVMFENLVTSETLDIDLTSAKGTIANADVGNGKSVTITGVTLKDGTTGLASNYTLKNQPSGVTVNITQAPTPTAPTGLTGILNAALSTVKLPTGWSWEDGAVSMSTAGSQNFNANYHDSNGNYADGKKSVNVNVMNKANADVTISGVPTSKTYGDANFTLTADKTAPDSGTWSWASSDDTILKIVSGANTATATIQVLKANTAGATLTVTYESDTHYGTVTTASIPVSKKALTIRPKSYTITKGQAIPAFELEYVGLVSGDEMTPSTKATFKCVEDPTSATSKDVSTNTVPGKYYIEWTNSNDVTFTGLDNYDVKTETTGTLTIQAQPSGSGSSSGGGSTSGSGTVKTETTKNNDGSVTKTETKRDGTVIETTTGKDGSVSKTTTNPNGSSVTETKAADGSTGTVKTDERGQTTAETTLSSKAIETAKRNGEPVKAPVEVKATRDSSTAPTVKIELPRNSGDTKVEIPVTNVKPGTVAVIVHPDGTEEIVKNSLPTEDGIQLTVNGGATVKIVDNSKDFIDTRAHWAKDAIDFVSARGLVNGMNAVSYAPDASTTRAQLWTILARQNDADLSGGTNWYEKAQLWAKDKGVSDGANPNAAINRAQMVTMLWRTMGQPAAASGASFADVPADSYYAQAVAWAVENGITTGVGDGRFDPNSACTRGQIATFLYRYMK